MTTTLDYMSGVGVGGIAYTISSNMWVSAAAAVIGAYVAGQQTLSQQTRYGLAGAGAGGAAMKLGGMGQTKQYLGIAAGGAGGYYLGGQQTSS